MIYQGDYVSNTIYGASNNNRIKVDTVDGATFLSCNLLVDFSDELWEHNFEVPFFNNTAELYFENYIHSIITQKFDLLNVNTVNYEYYHYNLANIVLTVKEMHNNVVLDELEHDFFMILGKFQSMPLADLNTSGMQLLELDNSAFLTKKGVLSFCFLSNTLPEKLIIDNGITQTELNLVVSPYDTLLHVLTIPAVVFESQQSTAVTLSLKFSSNTIYPLGMFNIIDPGVDHNLIAYQNQFGTISIVELTGERKDDENRKTSIQNYTINAFNRLNETEITESYSIIINSGYVLDSIKYEMLRRLVKSYNKFLVTTGSIDRIVNNGSQRFKPYKTNYYENNENLKFKISQNDDIHYRNF